VDLLVNLGVLLEGDVLHVAHSAPKDVPRMYTALGRRAVAQCTALGKVLLADRPWEAVRALVEQHGWRSYTASSIQDFERLEAELARTRERGYALDHEERRIGVACLAAPIRDYSGRVVAALSVSGAAEKMTPAFRDRLLPRVLEAASRVSFRLGDHSSAAYL
jgi:DNA-binding IclR family transcriptional regulator